MLPMAHLKAKIEPAQVQITLINLLYDAVWIAEHTVMETLWLYIGYQELQNLKIYHLKNLMLTSPFTALSAKFVCSPAGVNMHKKINLDHTPQSLETTQGLSELCEEYKIYLF